jgi:hypothetical protein
VPPATTDRVEDEVRDPVPPPMTISPEANEWTVAVPVTTRSPLNREVPNTERVVEGESVPIPTLPSLALTTKVDVSIAKPPDIVDVAVAAVLTENMSFRVKAPLTLRVELNVDEAYAYIPADVLVGAKVLAQSCCQAPGEPSKAKPVTAICMVPAPGVMDIFDPSDNVAATGAEPVDPMRS